MNEPTITVVGNLTADPDSGVSEKETDWTRLRVAVNDRRLNEQSGQWEDGDTVFHDVVVFGKQARNAAASLRKGENEQLFGSLESMFFGTIQIHESNSKKVYI